MTNHTRRNPLYQTNSYATIKKTKTILVVNKCSSLAILIILMLAPNRGTTQERRISTAVPFLNIQTDARSAGIGGLGVASSADVFSQQGISY